MSGEQIPAANELITAANADRLTLFARWGHGYGRIYQLRFATDGSYLLATSSIGIHFYDTKTNALVRSIETDADVRGLAISPDNKILAATTADGVHIFDTVSSDLIRTLAANQSWTVSFSPDGRTLAVGGEHLVQLWDPKSGALIREFEASDDFINAIAFSPDGQLIATASNSTRLWSVDGTLLDNHGPYVSGGRTSSLSFSPDGRSLAQGTDLDTIVLHTVSPNRTLVNRRLIGAAFDEGAIGNVAFSPDGAWLAAYTASGLFVYNAHTWAPAARLDTPYNPYTRVAVWAPDNKTIAFTEADLSISLWQPLSGFEAVVSNGIAGEINNMAWSPMGDEIAIGIEQDIAYLVDAQSGAIIRALGGRYNTTSLSFSPDGQTIAVGAGTDEVYLWNKEGEPVTTLEGAGFYGSTSVAFSADGSTLITDIDTDRIQVENVQFWQTSDWTFLKAWELGESPITHLALAPAGDVFATSDREGDGIMVRDASTGRPIKNLSFPKPGSGAWVRAMAFAPNSTQLASLSTEWRATETIASDLWLRLWTPEWREPLYGMNIIPSSARKGAAFDLHSGLVWSPDGTLLAMGLPDGSVQLRRASDGELLVNLEGHTLWATCVAFSPDGKMLASASLDGTIRIWAVR